MTFQPLQHRYCSRCRCELSDVASMERGMGPQCAGKSTKLYAKTIPANYAMANLSSLGIRDNDMHVECHVLWHETRQKLLEATQNAANQEQGNSFSWTGEDLRRIVKNIDYILSYRHPRESTREQLITIVRHLGYIGLAGVLSGEASTGESRLWFEEGKVKLQGSRNKRAYRAFAAIRGVTLPRSVGQPYMAPVSLLEPFLSLVLQYYPMYEGDFEEVRSSAAAWVPPPPARTQYVMTPSVLDALDGVAYFRVRSEDFTLQFNWMRNTNMSGFISSLKSGVPYNSRAYDPVSKLWRFKKEYLDTIKGIITSSGIFSEVVETISGDITPPNSYEFGNNRNTATTYSSRRQRYY